EVLGSQPDRDLVTAEAKIAYDQPVPREPRVQRRLQPAAVLKSLRERVADDGDVIAFAQLERRGGPAARRRRGRERCRDAAHDPSTGRHRWPPPPVTAAP